MTSGQKVALSLLISVLAFCAFTVVAFSGLFDILEVNFYQPVVQQIKQKKIEEIAAAQNEYFDTLIRRFDAFTVNSDVKTYVENHPADSSVRERELLRSQLLTATSAVKNIRIIDSNGRNIYFSTFPSDVISSKSGIAYRDYDKIDEISFNSVAANSSVAEIAPSEKKCRIIKDGVTNQIIFSLPFFDANSRLRATILFYCDAANFSQFLFNKNLIDISGFASLVTTPRDSKKNLDGFGGFVFGLPNYGVSSLQKQILSKWKESESETFWKLEPSEPKNSENQENPLQNQILCAFSHAPTRADFGFITFLYNDSELKFPQYMRILLLVTAFITFYLAVFLILSFKHDDIVVIRDKIRRYETEFFINYKKMGEKSQAYLEEQKPVLERRILKSLGKKALKHSAEVKSIFETCWQELCASSGEQILLSQPQAVAPIVNAEELKKIVRSSLEEILEGEKLGVRTEKLEVREPGIKAAESKSQSHEAAVHSPAEEVAPAEEVESVEEVEPVEEVAPAEEIEPVEEAEPIDEEEPVEAIEPVEEVESVEEIEPVEEVAPAEEIEPVEEAEPIEEIEPAEEIEPVEEVESLDEEIEPLEEAESVEELAPIEEEIEPVEELDDDVAVDFTAVDKIDSIEALDDEELEILPEYGEKEARADEIARTLAALPENPIDLTKESDNELDKNGLSRKLSWSEQHDFDKLHAAIDFINETDSGLEELEEVEKEVPEVRNQEEEAPLVEEVEPPEEMETGETQSIVSETEEAYVQKVLDLTIYPDDEIYKDENLLEKIEFGVPQSDILDEETDDSVADNFVACAPDYSFLDDDDADELLYKDQPQKELTENEHFFVNKDVAQTDDEGEKDVSLEEPEELEDTEEFDEIEEPEEVEILEGTKGFVPFTLTKLDAVEEKISSLEKI